MPRGEGVTSPAGIHDETTAARANMTVSLRTHLRRGLCGFGNASVDCRRSTLEAAAQRAEHLRGLTLQPFFHDRPLELAEPTAQHVALRAIDVDEICVDAVVFVHRRQVERCGAIVSRKNFRAN